MHIQGVQKLWFFTIFHVNVKIVTHIDTFYVKFQEKFTLKCPVLKYMYTMIYCNIAVHVYDYTGCSKCASTQI